MGVAGHLVTRGKAGQRRIDLLNLFETFGGELGSLVKASMGRGGDTATKKGDNGSWAIREFRGIKSLTAVLFVMIINIAQPKVIGQTHRRGCSTSVRRCRSSSGRDGSSGSRGEAGQRRMDLLNLFETFLGELRGVGKASLRRALNTTGKKGDNGGRAIREISRVESATAVLFVIIISIVEQKIGRSNAPEGL